MINQKYYQDIKRFPKQFEEGFDLAKNLKVEGNFSEIVLCGMGGSSSFVRLLNDVLATNSSQATQINSIKGYDLPKILKKETLFLLVSYSGNTEEVLNIYKQVLKNNLSHIVITTGGELEKIAQENMSAILKIPGGIQPRLSTGYFISGIFQLLINCNLIDSSVRDLVIKASKGIGLNFNEEDSKSLAKELKNKIPIIYSTDNNTSLAELSKIKFNENSKIQSFWNYFPELNHNEMVGFTNLIMEPYFIIFKSQFTNIRNFKRIEIFNNLMEEKNIKSTIFDLKGENVFEEIMMGYYFIDHVTFYLAEEYGIDPEPVKMVEDFKKMLEQ